MRCEPDHPVVDRARGGRLLVLTVLLMMLLTTAAVMPEDVEAQGHGRKDITLYLHNVTSARQVGSVSTLRLMNTTMGDTLNTTVQTSTSLQDDWYLYPVLANDTTVHGSVTLHIWALRTARTGDSRQATLEVTLHDIDETGANSGTVATASESFNMINDWREYRISATDVTRYTVQKGHTLRLEFDLHGSSSNFYQIAWGDSSKRSRLDIETYDWVRVDGVDVLDHTGTPRTNFMLTEADKSITFRAEVTDPFGGYDIRYANATLVTPDGTEVLDMATMDRTGGYFNSYRSEFSLGWNYSGYPTGRYNLTVHAVDNTGYYYRFPTNPGDTTYGGHQVSMTTSFWIGGMPHNATVSVVDGSNQTLSGAIVDVADRSGVTNGSGTVVLQVPNGTYVLRVLWQDVLVYNGTALVEGDTTFNVTAAVYSPSIIAVDDIGDVVADAVVVLEHPNGSVIKGYWRTDASGTFQLVQVPGGTYGLSVLWRDVEVYNDPLGISSNGPYTISLRIFSLAVSVVDDVGDGIGMAQVVVTNHTTGLVTDSKLTNLTGVAMTRLPVGGYDFTVYWRNVLVFDSLSDHLVDSSGTLDLQADVFQITLLVEDSTGVPIEGASVVVGFAATNQVSDFGTTDEDGTLVTKMPVGSYDLWVYWRDVQVHHTDDLLVEKSGTLTIVCDVHWVDITVLDARGSPVSLAFVTMFHEEGLDFGTKVTDDAGGVAYRLPVGTYGIDVRWRDSPVYSGEELIDSNDPVELHVSVFYLDLSVADSMSVPIEAAIVTVVNDTTLASMGSAFTDDEGKATFRLPRGSYRATTVWMDTLVHEATYVLEGNSDQQVAADVFYVLFIARDSRGVGLHHAQVLVTNGTTGRAMGGQTTDLEGETTYRLPVGEYDVEVRWQQSLVYLDTWFVDIDATDVLECRVYYSNFHVVDADGIDLVGAHVSLANSSAGTALGPASTDGSGEVEFRLPAGEVAMTVTWRSVVVYEDPAITVEEDLSETISASVYYLYVEVVGSDGEAVGNADLNVMMDGEIVASAITTGEGPEVFRLPVGHYSVNMTFRASYLLTRIDVAKGEEFDLDANRTVTFELSEDEYPLPIYSTNLFWVVLTIALLLVVIVLLLYRMRTVAGGREEHTHGSDGSADDHEGDHDGPAEEHDEERDEAEDDEETHVVEVPLR